MAVRFTNPFAQWVNGSSVIQASAKLYFYATGTSTPKNSFSDSDLTTPNTNPVVADANGNFGNIFLETGLYKVVLKTSADVTIWTADPVGDSLSNVTIAGTFALNGALTTAQITATADNYNPTGLSSAVTLRLNSDASRDLTGIAGGSAGRILIIRNVGSFNIVLKDEGATSTAANRFALFSDVTLQPEQTATLQYDAVSSRWFPITVPVSSTFTSTLTMSGAAINEAKGADIASATTTNIGAATGNFVDVTGTTTITGLGTVQAGTERTVRFTGALILTHNATSLILPTAANITTAANDRAVFRSLGSGNWLCVDYIRADGTALTSSSGIGAVSVQAFTASGTWTKPAGVKYVRIVCVAGGGGGGGGTAVGGGGGGGGGGTAEKILDVTAISSAAITIGAAGSAGAAGAAGGAGGNTSFATNCQANGGAGGGASAGGAGGAGGTAPTGDVLIPGETGRRGGYGGGIDGSGGDGGNSLWGGGAPGPGAATTTSTTNGIAASNYGAGGSGCYNGSAASSPSVTGGAGTAGICIVYEFK